MSKKIRCLFLLFMIAACGSEEDIASVNYTPVAVNYTNDIKNAAETGLPRFISSIEIGNQWANFGFASKDEVAYAQLGTPYPIFKLDNPGRIDQTVSILDRWYFPVMANDNYRCILEVAKTAGQWKAVSIGGAPIAASLQATEKSHPTLEIKNRGILEVYGFSSAPYRILMINFTENQPSFLMLPPFAPDLVRKLPQYTAWVNTDPVPVLSFEEIYVIFAQM